MAEKESMIIQSRPGMVRLLESKKGGMAPGVLSIKGQPDKYEGKLESQEGVIVTSVGVKQDVNIQFSPSLKKVVYVYSFGDRPGNCTVQGLAFHRTCEKKNSKGWAGTKSLMDYYDRNRAVTEDRLMKLTIGDWSVQGYLIRVNMSIEEPMFKTMGFTLTMIVIPKPGPAMEERTSAPSQTGAPLLI